ncbi:MAG: hypothetical protein EBV86_11985, partial [Marivivens sp.]|nr:hypothetical protein [Marivivens sp.]
PTAVNDSETTAENTPLYSTVMPNDSDPDGDQLTVTQFVINGTTVSYTGPTEWSYRRFILHYAHLCAAAGGVGVFCIGPAVRSRCRTRQRQDHLCRRLVRISRDAACGHGR